MAIIRGSRHRILLRPGVVLTLVLSLALIPQPAFADQVDVAMVRYARFEPPEVTAGRGDTVLWTNSSPTKHTTTSTNVIEANPDGTPGPALWRTPKLLPDQTYAFQFFAAGRYAYYCVVHTSMDGTVDVPLTVRTAPASEGTRITVILATRTAPDGFVYDVQRMSPPLPIWQDWQVGITAKRASFVAVDPGTYTFRARIRRVSTEGVSLYSPEGSVTV